MRCIICAEAATGHGGDISIAKDLASAAADAGADFIKYQSYQVERINPKDPQADWLRKAYLGRAAHEALMAHCESRHIKFLSTPFDPDSLQMLRDLGLKTFKMASSESHAKWWDPRVDECWFVSYPWGLGWARNGGQTAPVSLFNLTAIPLYPTPLEAVGRATLLDGWSDHGQGLDTCFWAIARGVKVLEAHITLGNGRGRQMPFDRTPQEFARLREFADNCATITSGVATKFSERWKA